MTQIEFIHAADFHLDAPFRGGRQGYGQIRRGDVRRTFSATVELAISRNAQLLLLCGDLFEQDGVTRDTLAFVSRELRRLHDTQVLLLPGNHDPLSLNSWYHAVRWPAHVHVLEVDGPRAAVLDLPELAVAVAGYGFTGVVQDTPDFTTLPAPRTDRFNLLLLHGSLDAPPADRGYHRVTTEQLRQSGYVYVAMGHYHSSFLLPGEPTIANPGSPEPLGFDEPGSHGVLAGTLLRQDGRVRVRVEPVALAVREYVDCVVDVTDADTPEALRYAIASVLHGLRPERHLPRIRLTGDPLESPDVQALSEWMDDSWLLTRLVDETLPTWTGAGALSPGSLAGVFAARMSLRIAQAEDAGDAERVSLLRQARRMGLEALTHGQVHPVPHRLGG